MEVLLKAFVVIKKFTLTVTGRTDRESLSDVLTEAAMEADELRP